MCASMRLSQMTMRGILFFSSLTPKAFHFKFIQIGFSVMQTAISHKTTYNLYFRYTNIGKNTEVVQCLKL